MNFAVSESAARSAPPPRSLAQLGGIRLSYRIQGEGPPLLLIMGYRLSSDAWPEDFVEALAQNFTVITFDNRGTGESDKPVTGYAIDNLARDARDLVDFLGIDRLHVFGYSMGGAVAQEFVRQFPERVDRLILCATMCGGPLATYARADVQSVMKNIKGLQPDEAARLIWTVTYSPDYLAQHRDKAEQQMQREIVTLTPLHAADLQYQAFAFFNCSASLPEFRCPTLVITGDLDALIPPQNAYVLSRLIPGAHRIVFAGRGHRLIWEATEECVATVEAFLNGSPPDAAMQERRAAAPSLSNELTTDGLGVYFLSTFERMTADALYSFGHSLFRTLDIPYGDGKPVIIVSGPLTTPMALSAFANWIQLIGYRPSVCRPDELDAAITKATRRFSRKTVLISFAAPSAVLERLGKDGRDRVSDIVHFGAAHVSERDGVRLQRPQVSLWWPDLPVSLARILGQIPIELI